MENRDENEKKDLVNRLATIEGHIAGIKKMVEKDKSCEAILIQLSAISSSINRVVKIVLKEHIDVCVKQAVEDGDTEIVGALSKVLDRYI